MHQRTQQAQVTGGDSPDDEVERILAHRCFHVGSGSG